MLQLVENTDYQLVPSKDDNDSWEVRFLTGPFPETVIQYGSVQLDGRDREQDVEIKFNFRIIESPDINLSTTNAALQEYAGDVLYMLVQQSIADGSLQSRETDKEIE